MRSRHLILLAAAFLSATFSLSAQADDGAQIGRRRDGTAYRTDSAGNQLSDYIAELEVTNAELRRQLTAAEDQRGSAPAPVAVNTPPPPVPVCPVCQYTQNSETNAVNEAVSHAINTTVATERARCDAQIQTAANESSQSSTLNCEQQAERRLTETQNELNKKLAKITEENQAIAQQLIDTQDRLALAEKREQQRASLQAAAPTPAPVISAPIAPATASRIAAAPIDPTADLTPRKSFASELATIQNLITSRKSLLDTLRSRRPSIALSPQNLVTKEGTSLDTLRGQIANSGGIDSDGRLLQGLAEIQTILKDDISVLTRLVNNG